MKTKEQKKAEATQRQAQRQALSPHEQLRRLDERLGKDQGAAKERARLRGLL